MTVISWPRHVRCNCDVAHDDGGWSCPLCSGGLFVCEVCGGAEGAMPTDCPGRLMTSDEICGVLAGDLNYVRSAGWFAPGKVAEQ